MRTVGTWGLAFVLAVLMTLPGCGRREPSPQKVFRDFHGALLKYSREPWPGYRAQAWALLSEDSKARFEAVAEEVNSRLPEGIAPFEAQQLLVVRHVESSAALEEVEVADATAETVRLRVKSKDLDAEVRLVREGGTWRVALFEGAGGS